MLLNGNLAGVTREICSSLFFLRSLAFSVFLLISPFSSAVSLCHGGTLALVISLKVPRFVITPLGGNVLRNSQAGFVTNESRFQ